MHPSIQSIVFSAVFVLIIVSAIGVVTMRNIFMSAIALVGTLSLVAALFVLLGADFLGASQILVYVGGIMIIMLFAVMLSQQPLDSLQRQTNNQWLPGFLCAAVIGASLAQGYVAFKAVSAGTRAMMPTSSPLGRLILGEMVLPFEVVSLVLLAALVGAVLFAQDPKKGDSK